ncbi:MAG: 3-deoxy-manno-octulosonate cytidylyltransferase [Syntrophobacteraceae bacterium]
MKVVIVIPARYASTRLPGKPLIDINGKPMIQHVYERARQASLASEVVVATDDERIVAAVEGFRGRAILTDANHQSGTDRVIEVASTIQADIFINVQGDEPLIRPGDIDLLIRTMVDDPGAEVATLSHPIAAENAANPNDVKVVTTHDGFALYFSRHPIPFPRDGARVSYMKHIGVYGYRVEILRLLPNLPASPLEAAEKLEQLRLLQSGIRIKVVPTAPAGPGVDTPECLERVRRIMASQHA